MHLPHELIQLFGYTRRQARQLQCTAEHLVPRCEGGGDNQSNIVAACRRCNQARHKRSDPPSPERFVQIVQARLARDRWHAFQRLPAKAGQLMHLRPQVVNRQT
nr:HNH endonuclease [Caenimonas sp. SL110]